METGDSLTLKLIEDFKVGPNLHELKIRTATARMSGAFPLPNEMSTPIFEPKMYNKRIFDDTFLSRNDSIIKKMRTSMDDSSDSLDCTDSSSVPASPWELKRMKGELIAAKAEISLLEARVNKLHSLRKETEVVFEQEKLSMKHTIEKDKNTIHELELKLKKLRKRELSLKELLSNQEEDNCNSRRAVDSKNIELMDENSNLKATISDLNNEKNELTRELSSLKVEVEGLKKELSTSIEQTENLKSQLSDLQAISIQHDKDKALLTIANHKIAELESELKNFGETSALLKQQQSKLLRCSDLERQVNVLKQENTKLRESSSKVIYLESTIEGLKARLTILDEKDRELRQIRVDLGVANGQLNEFKSLAQSYISDSPSYSKLSAYIRELQEAHLIAHSQTTTLKARLKTVEDVNEKLNEANALLKTEITKLTSEIEQQSGVIKRLKKQHAIVTWERDDLRKMLDSLQKETTVMGSDSKIEALELLVDGYRKRVEEMEGEPQTYVNIAGMKSRPSLCSSNEQSCLNHLTEIDALKKERIELLDRIDKMEYEIEHRNLKGDFNNMDTKILHMKVNPFSEAVEKREDELEKAHAELAVLREKVKLLKEGGQGAGVEANVTMQASERVQQISSKEIDELREKLKSQEVQKERLVEAFKTKSQEFREAVCTLLGYHVSSSVNKTYKLTSMYADSPSHYLLFQMSDHGMELLETEFSKTLSELIAVHLCQQHSIPMFLSTLTSDLFNRHNQSSILA